jgi:hypothetical protein
MTLKGEKAVSRITWGEVSLGNAGREVWEEANLGGKLIVRMEGMHWVCKEEGRKSGLGEVEGD